MITRVLKKGDTGADVLELQSALLLAGFVVGPLDGAFWVKTEAAVKDLQRSRGLNVDGRVGKNTCLVLGIEFNATPVTGSRPSSDKNIPTPPVANWTFGIDISKWQPTVDYKKLVLGGVKFCWAKATEGRTVKDARFKQHEKGCRDNGIIFGAYHYLRPDLDPIEQAKFLLSVYKPVKGDLHIMCDNESHGSFGHAHDIQAACMFMDYLIQHGYPVIHYSYVGFLNAQKNPQAYFKYPLDIAHYGPAITKGPSLPPPFRGWDFWQYNASTPVNGIQGDVDHDIFNGSVEELKAKFTYDFTS